MTDDRIEGAVRKGVGRVQDAVGGLTGDGSTQARGKANEAAGSAQNAFGKVVGQAEDLARDQPLVAVGAAFAVGVVVGLLLRGGKD